MDAMVRHTLSGNEFAPSSLRGNLNLRFSSLSVNTILTMMGISGDDAGVRVAILDEWWQP